MLKRCFVFQSLQERKQRKALAEAAALFQLIQIDLKIRIRKMLLFFLPLQRRDGVAIILFSVFSLFYHISLHSFTKTGRKRKKPPGSW